MRGGKYMKNIEVRLSRIERETAQGERVQVQYKDLRSAEMDLLPAVKLLIAGKVRTISAPWKPGEKELHLSGVALDIENYLAGR